MRKIVVMLILTMQSFAVSLPVPKLHKKRHGNYIIVEPSIPVPVYLPQMDYCGVENTSGIKNQRQLALCLLKT